MRNPSSLRDSPSPHDPQVDPQSDPRPHSSHAGASSEQTPADSARRRTTNDGKLSYSISFDTFDPYYISPGRYANEDDGITLRDRMDIRSALVRVGSPTRRSSGTLSPRALSPTGNNFQLNSDGTTIYPTKPITKSRSYSVSASHRDYYRHARDRNLKIQELLKEEDARISKEKEAKKLKDDANKPQNRNNDKNKHKNNDRDRIKNLIQHENQHHNQDDDVYVPSPLVKTNTAHNSTKSSIKQEILKYDKLTAKNFQRRCILCYISGRRHTWVALDYLSTLFLKNGDYLVITASVSESEANRIARHSNYDDDIYHPRSRSVSNIRASPSRDRGRNRNPLSRIKSLDPNISINHHLAGNEIDSDNNTSAQSAETRRSIATIAKDIINYVSYLIDPNLVISVRVDIIVGSTKDTLKEGVELYQPTLIVTGAKNTATTTNRSDDSKKLSDRLLVKSPVPVILVPGNTMANFEIKVMKILKGRLKILYDNSNENIAHQKSNAESIHGTVNLKFNEIHFKAILAKASDSSRSESLTKEKERVSHQSSLLDDLDKEIAKISLSSSRSPSVSSRPGPSPLGDNYQTHSSAAIPTRPQIFKRQMSYSGYSTTQFRFDDVEIPSISTTLNHERVKTPPISSSNGHSLSTVRQENIEQETSSSSFRTPLTRGSVPNLSFHSNSFGNENGKGKGKDTSNSDLDNDPGIPPNPSISIQMPEIKRIKQQSSTFGPELKVAKSSPPAPSSSRLYPTLSSSSSIDSTKRKKRRSLWKGLPWGKKS